MRNIAKPHNGTKYIAIVTLCFHGNYIAVLLNVSVIYQVSASDNSTGTRPIAKVIY